MKKLFVAGVAALSVLSTSVAYAADESDPPLPRFRPWQQVWQCNDIRVTVTARDPFSIEYDLGGTIWGGSRFTVVKGELFFNGRPCLSLQPVGYSDALHDPTCCCVCTRDQHRSRNEFVLLRTRDSALTKSRRRNREGASVRKIYVGRDSVEVLANNLKAAAKKVDNSLSRCPTQ